MLLFGFVLAMPTSALAPIPLLVPVFDPANFTVNTSHNAAYYLKEFVVYPLVRKVANSLENKLINKVSGQISGVTGGNPNFITNWRNHILDSQARGNDVFRSVLADTKLCPGFAQNLKTAFGADLFKGVLGSATVKNSSGQVVYQNKTNTPGLPSFQYSAGCTLPISFNATTINQDFSKGGGWAAWDQLIQPQNNIFGAYSLATQEQSKQIAVEKQASQDSSVAGQGFLSQKLGVGASGLGPTGCTSSSDSVDGHKILVLGGETPAIACFRTCKLYAPKIEGLSEKCITASAYDAGCEAEKAKIQQAHSDQDALCKSKCDATVLNRCVFQGKTVTPEQILGKTAVAAIDKKLGRIGGSTQVTDILLSLFNAVLDATTNKLANYIGQATYDRPPGSSGSLPEQQFAPDSNDANTGSAQNQGGQIQQQCLRDCQAQQQSTCGELPPTEQQSCLDNSTNTCNQRCVAQ